MPVSATQLESLIDFLATNYPERSEAVSLWQRSGGRPGDFTVLPRPITTWRQMLIEVQAGKLPLEQLLEVAQKDYPYSSVLAGIIQSLDRPVAPPSMSDKLTSLEDLRAIGDNASTLRRLLEPERRNSLIPFVGAGVSVPFGFPGWTALLTTLAERYGVTQALQDLLGANAYEDAASLLERTMHPFGFREALIDAYGDAKLSGLAVSGVPRLLAEHAPGPVITTNFDRVLEHAAEQAGRRFETIVEGEQRDRFSRVLQSGHGLVKLHGSFDERQNRVLTREEYDRAYGAGRVDFTRPLPQFLRTLLQARTLLFVGCSLVQDRTLKVLSSSVQDFDDGSVHFALLPWNPEERVHRIQALAQHHILPVWYPNGQFAAIPRILQAVLTP